MMSCMSQDTFDSRLAERLVACSCFQIRSLGETVRSDAFDDEVAVNPARAARPRAEALAAGDCPFCRRRTPPAILEAVDGQLLVPEETESLRRGKEWLATEGGLTAANAQGLMERFEFYNNLRRHAACRTLPNLYASTTLGPGKVTASLVTTMSDACHDADVSDCPLPLLTHLIESWRALERVARRFRWTPVFFANAGGVQSGQSIPCPHAQTYMLDREPALYGRLRATQASRLTLAREESLIIRVPGLKRVSLLAHPAPRASCSLLILPLAPEDTLDAAATGEIAHAFQQGVWLLRRHLGRLPAYNFVLRSGIGVWMAEIVPRNTTIAGGAELATGWTGVDTSPGLVRQALAAAQASATSAFASR